ncbi:uncharacterized protein LOC131632216 [Vicia villosa]|uniref:uncharacterized protein LOC131632216 n=1 Tax=Vicia villosa TaxID=3911 RepID=UPI00273C7E0E|nr:uncharacterized protein LOC131632216 [Vicia villosa]
MVSKDLLKQYIKGVDVYVSSHFDVIKHMLSKPIMHSQIGKWSLALTKYSLTYLPLKAMKGQVVADFLVEHSMVAMPQNYVDLVPWKLYFDGFSHKDGAGIGGIIISPNGIPVEFKYTIDGTCTNNEVEYESLITRVELLLELGARNVKIMGDFELVIKQVSREYRCVKENLIMYFVIVNRLLKQFELTSIRHMPRRENQEANNLVQEASRYKKNEYGEIIQVREKVQANLLSPSDLLIIKLGAVDAENFEIFTIDNGQDNDWRKPLVEYLHNPTGSTDIKIKYRALSFVLIENELFKKTAEGILLKCLRESEAYIVVSSVHSGACGAHQAEHKMKWILMRSSVYWPSILKDCNEFAKDCQECQMHGGIQHIPASELHAIVKPWPFIAWDLDVIGEIKTTLLKQQRYILVDIDYFTKWIPETITTDQGTMFTGRKCRRRKPKNWHQSLDQALWAYITSPKEAIGAMPFRLAYGHDAVFLVEIHVQSVRIQRQHEILFEDYWNMMADELVDLDEERMLALDSLRGQKDRVAKAYNKKVKDKVFTVDVLVWNVVLPIYKNDRFLGKWSPS